MSVDAEYLVVGAGAAGLAFCDTLLSETDATITLVDERQFVGGHWVDAYPFITLDQPGRNYGVNSVELVKTNALDEAGLNRGLGRLCDLDTVLSYFQTVQEKLDKSNRFKFVAGVKFDWSEQSITDEVGMIKRVSPETKLVDATLSNTEIPLRSEPKFSYDNNATVIPPNCLPERLDNHDSVVVIGGGKTGIDVVLWLLEQSHLNADNITWIISRDFWFINRQNLQDHPKLALRSLKALADQCQISLSAGSLADYSLEMEAMGHLLRLDRGFEPSAFHGASVSKAEIDRLRSLKKIVRKGRVKSVRENMLLFAEGDVPISENALILNCTASGVGHMHSDDDKVFSPSVLKLLPLRCFQVPFSAALIAKIESLPLTLSEKNKLARPMKTVDTLSDWATNQPKQIQNEIAWASNPELAKWLQRSRLNPIGRLIASPPPDQDATQMIADILGLSVKSATHLEAMAR